MLNGMVERRMRQAISLVGSLWYTAWVNAGQPDLETLGNKEILDSLKIQSEISGENLKKNKIKNIKGHEN